ncbi:hypothetical protein QO200_18925 [Flavobacterium sp. Arc3]|uniref:hypothetical protein n=1 Tax=Flavobacterium sp. Arc3 TaxID=3046686 RepID=UPI00352BFEFF
MNQNIDKITDLIHYTFENRKGKYKFSEILDHVVLLKQGVLKIVEKDLQYLEINLDSFLFNELLLNIAETELKRKLPDNIIDTFLFIDDFEKYLKNKYSIDDSSKEITNSINALKAFVLTILNNQLSVYDFYVEFIKDKKQKRRDSSDFIDPYFQFLIITNACEEVILSSCIEYNNSEKHPSNYIYNFLRGLGKNHSTLAKQLAEFGIKNDFQKYSVLIPNLFIGLYNEGHNDTFDDSILIFEKDPITALKAFSGYNLSNGSDIKQLFELLNKIEPITVELVNLKSVLFCNFIENDNASAEIKENSIKELVKLLKSEDHKKADSAFQNIQYNLEKYEYEKYYLLNVYLNNTQNFNVFNYFFHNFKNPQYLFDILIKRYDASGFRGSIDLFKNSLNHFLDTNKEETEEQILDLFNFRKYSLLAVKIILSTHGGVHQVNLLKLSEKQAQLFAIDSICNYPNSIDDLLPLLLKLKESNLKEVKDYLQTMLAELIFEVYQESLLDLIKKNLTNSKKDKDFLIPLQKAFDEYSKMREFKAKIKDLDPKENERNLMDLYYRLEHENQAKMMKNIDKDKNSFLSMMKNMVIVRGRAWKNDDSEDILPLGYFESSMMIDTRAYKNPPVYEQNLENF